MKSKYFKPYMKLDLEEKEMEDHKYDDIIYMVVSVSCVSKVIFI